VTATMGHAQFSSLRSTSLGLNVLNVSTDGLFTLSNAFIVTVGPASVILILQQPLSGTGGLPLQTQPHLRIVDACNNSVVEPILFQVELMECNGSLSKNIIIIHSSVYNVSEIRFNDISLKLACRNNFLTFKCISCGLNGSNVTSRSTFFDVNVGALKQLTFAAKPDEQKFGGETFGLPNVILSDAGFNQLLTSGELLNFSVTFRNDTFFASSVAGVSGTATFPQFRLNLTGEYLFQVSAADANVLIARVFVLLGALAKLSFEGIPENPVSEQSISVVKVSLFDLGGNSATSPVQTVTLRLQEDPALFGILSVASLNGTAYFHDLRIGTARIDHRFVATCLNISTISAVFQVKPGRLFNLSVFTTVPSVTLSQYTPSGFLQSDFFSMQIIALDHFGNSIPNVNITMNSYGDEQLSAIGSKWNTTTSNGLANFKLTLTDEPSYGYPENSFVAQFIFASQNISVISNPIVGLARLNSRLKFTEQHIELLFNAPLTMQPLPYIAAASCNLVLSRKTLLQLGSDPVCFLVTSVEYRIRFGIGSSIMPSDTVVFLSTFGVAAAVQNYLRLITAKNTWLEFPRMFQLLFQS